MGWEGKVGYERKTKHFMPIGANAACNLYPGKKGSFFLNFLASVFVCVLIRKFNNRWIVDGAIQLHFCRQE